MLEKGIPVMKKIVHVFNKNILCKFRRLLRNIVDVDPHRQGLASYALNQESHALGDEVMG